MQQKLLKYISLGLCITFLQFCSVVEVSQLDPQNYPDEGTNLNFEDHIYPIFSDSSVGQRCTNCHYNNTPLDVNGLILQEGNGETLVTIYESLFINAGQGLRIDLSSPSSSLLVTYPAGQSPHIQAFSGGSSNSAYQTILAWIQAGAPY
ncbi:MAG TPA: hypothetical protein PKC21_01450 [Oligoflexia bacterium]|nr:hypothetical protein [Oligoflexia bacterium]